MIQKIVLQILLSLSILTLSTATMAWGGRGHDSICRAAVFLVQNPELRGFLSYRPHIMGHLCNIPDTHWRNMGEEVGKIGGPTHYFDIECVGGKFPDVSPDFLEFSKTWKDKDNSCQKGKKFENLSAQVGTLWWRADQFYRRAVALKAKWKEIKPAKNFKEESDMDFPANRIASDFIENIGLMGHYVGDVSMPYHSSSDYDGYDTGHGGIHNIYETDAVATIGPDLEIRVIEEGKKLQKGKAPFLKSRTNIVERMRALAQMSYPEMIEITKIDKLKSPSTHEIDSSSGKPKKKAAERADKASIYQKFEPLIITEMARSAALLAQLWDEAYDDMGKPDFSKLVLYHFPFTPEFVPPDYTELKP